jgi:hypothetical protein
VLTRIHSSLHYPHSEETSLLLLRRRLASSLDHKEPRTPPPKPATARRGSGLVCVIKAAARKCGIVCSAAAEISSACAQQQEGGKAAGEERKELPHHSMGAGMRILAALLALAVAGVTRCAAQLKQDYYAGVCPDVEKIVRDAVSKKVQETPVAVGATIRLFFHDCFVEVRPHLHQRRHLALANSIRVCLDVCMYALAVDLLCPPCDRDSRRGATRR